MQPEVKSGCQIQYEVGCSLQSEKGEEVSLTRTTLGKTQLSVYCYGIQGMAIVTELAVVPRSGYTVQYFCTSSGDKLFPMRI